MTDTRAIHSSPTSPSPSPTRRGYYRTRGFSKAKRFSAQGEVTRASALGTNQVHRASGGPQTGTSPGGGSDSALRHGPCAIITVGMI